MPSFRFFCLAGVVLVLSCRGTAPTASGPASRDSKVAGPTTQGDRAQPATSASPEAAANAVSIAIVGDSIAAGLHLPSEEAFPALLQRRLQTADGPVRMINAGVSGDTSAGGLRRIDWILKQHPDIVMIELGGNDGLRGIPVSEVEQNLRTMIDKTRASGATPLLLGVRLPPNYGPDYSEAFAGIYPRLAQEFGIAFVPFFMQGVAGVIELNLEDGLHPTPRGHQKLADNVEPELRKLVAAVRHQR